MTGRPPRPVSRRATVITAAGSCAVAGLVLPIAVALALPAVGLAVAGIAAGRRRRLERASRAAEVVELTVALAAELRAGRTPVEALAAAAPTAGSLQAVATAAGQSCRAGDDAGRVLLAAATLPGAEQLRWTAAAWSVADSAGGRVADVLDRIAVAMDDEAQLRQEMAAALAAPRATVLLLAGLPAFGLLIGQAIGADPLHLLVHRPLGWALLGGAGVLDLAGLALTRVIARAALRE